jgi:hypothetical protein
MDFGTDVSSFVHGLLVSALIVSSVVLLPSPVFGQGCNYTYGDVLAHDDGSTLSVIGNRGDVWVNNLSSPPPHGIVRAMVTSTNIFTNFIEFGWSWGPDYSPSGRIWFIGWIVNGADSYYNGNGVAKNQYDNYSMRDANRTQSGTSSSTEPTWVPP